VTDQAAFTLNVMPSVLINPQTPTVAIWVQLSILCQTGLPSFVILTSGPLSIRVAGCQKLQMTA